MTLKEPVKLWLAALRSDEYRQGEAALHRTADDGGPDMWCCLGVACDVYLKAGGTLEVTKQRLQKRRRMSYDGDAVFLPRAVLKWLGLRTQTGSYASGSLVRANDKGVPFSEIADIIESEPEGLFEEAP